MSDINLLVLPKNVYTYFILKPLPWLLRWFWCPGCYNDKWKEGIFFYFYLQTHKTSKITKRTFSKLRNRKKIHSQNMYQNLHAETNWRTDGTEKEKLLHLQYRPTLDFWNPRTTQRCTVKATREACLNRKWPSQFFFYLRSYCEEWDCDVLLGECHFPAA